MGPFKTKVTEMLGIEHPVIMGGMTGVGTPELAAAVSLAGGLGIFAIHNGGTSEADIRAYIRKAKRLCRGKPFGVNLTILPAATPPPYALYMKCIVEEGCKIVETAGSNPTKYVKFFKSHGLITIHKCTSIRHALKAEKVGTDIISLDGFECAGHPGEDDVGNYVLQARGAETLRTPYVCSGGVGNGAQLVAALAMGAAGVNCGTLFCATKEANWHQNQKIAMVEQDELSTTLVLRPLINTSRVFKNRVSLEVNKLEAEKKGNFQFGDVAHLMAGKRGRVNVEKDGDIEDGIWSVGQSMGLIHDIPTVQICMDKFISDAHNSIKHRLMRSLTNSSKL